jgi:mannose-6-phosphate isomerase-like protein (cupin superfamily)
MDINNVNKIFGGLIMDEESDIQTRQIVHGDVSLIVAELKAGKKLPAHYHTKGSEIYQVISGNGHIELGQLLESGLVEWLDASEIKPGDILEVKPYVVHRLLGGEEDLRLVFITPPSHLGEDRIFIKN